MDNSKAPHSDVNLAIDLVNDATMRTDLIVGIEALSDVQFAVSKLLNNAVSDNPTNQQIIVTAYALSEEIHELIREVGWKLWKENPQINDENKARVLNEYADVLAFLGQLTKLIMNRWGITATDIADAYVCKSTKNVSRFMGESGEAGYIGVEKLKDDEGNNG